MKNKLMKTGVILAVLTVACMAFIGFGLADNSSGTADGIRYSWDGSTVTFSAGEKSVISKYAVLAVVEGSRSGTKFYEDDVIFIDSSITGIGDSAFGDRGCRTVIIADNSNLTSIGDYAFHMSRLRSITFGENSKLETIGEGALGWNNYKSITIPGSVTSIKDEAFANNYEWPTLETVVINSSTTDYGKIDKIVGPFRFCSKLSRIIYTPNEAPSIPKSSERASFWDIVPKDSIVYMVNCTNPGTHYDHRIALMNGGSFTSNYQQTGYTLPNAKGITKGDSDKLVGWIQSDTNTYVTEVSPGSPVSAVWGTEVYLDPSGGEGGNLGSVALCPNTPLMSLDDYKRNVLGDSDHYSPPEKSGYSFKGYWDSTYTTRYYYEDGTPDPRITSTTLPSGNTLYAKWVPEGKNVCKIGNIKYFTLQEAVDDVLPGVETTITMIDNTTECVTISDDKKIILDLNGCVINGNNAGSVLTLKNGATLTLKDGITWKRHYFNKDESGKLVWDSSDNESDYEVLGGLITGGKGSNTKGGGISIGSGCTLIMEGGNITGNSAFNYGGGVYNEGIFTMKGGDITYNYIDNYNDCGGGGVYSAGTSFTMTGGSITGNEAGDITRSFDGGNGGGVYLNHGTFTMTGGSITGNKSGGNRYGAGVYVSYMENCNMTVGGTAVITDNLDKANRSNNVYLSTGKTLTISSEYPLAETAKIGIIPQSFPEGPEILDVTGEYKSVSGLDSLITSDRKGYKVIETECSSSSHKLQLVTSYDVTVNAGEYGKIRMGSEPATSSITLEDVLYGTKITVYRTHLTIGTTEITAVPDENCYFFSWGTLPEKVTKGEVITATFTSDQYPVYLWDGTDYVNVLELPYSNLKDVTEYDTSTNTLTLKGYNPDLEKKPDEDNGAICSLDSKEFTIILKEETTNIIGSSENPVYVGIVSLGNLEIEGDGKLSISANASDSEKFAVGIFSSSDLKITGGDIDITLTPFGNDETGYSEAGIEAAGNLTISGGKTNIRVLNNSTVCYGIFANKSVNINGGETTIAGGYYGAVVGDTSKFTMTGGKFTCINSLYGLDVPDGMLSINQSSLNSLNLQTTRTAIINGEDSNQSAMYSANQSAADPYFQYEVSNAAGDGGKELIVGNSKDDLDKYQGTLEQAIAEGFRYIYITDDRTPYIDNFAVTINPSKESADSRGYVHQSYITGEGSTTLSVHNNILTVGDTQVTVTANPGYEFDSWENLSDGTVKTVTGELTVTAKFRTAGASEKTSSSVSSFFGKKDGNDFTFDRAVVITKATLPGATYATVTNTSGSGWYNCSLSTDGTNGTLYFQVPLDVIDIKGYTVNDVSLIGCKTTYLSSDNQYAYYSAVITGAGSYTIDFEKNGAVKAVTETKPVTDTQGYLNVLSTPAGATIQIEGVDYIGFTPQSKISLIPGTYTVTLSLAGYDDASKTVVVKAGETTEAVLSLTKTESTTPVTETAAKTPFPVLGILAGLGIAGLVALRRH